MGYTHYWAYQSGHPGYANAWPAILADTRTILDRARDLGIVVAGPRGDQSPVVDPGRGIAVNGDAAAGLRGEMFSLRPATGAGAGAWQWNCCKTDRNPYDLAVAAVLLRCCQLLPRGVFTVDSDGGWGCEWRYGATMFPAGSMAKGLGPRRLVADLFGTSADECPFTDTTVYLNPEAGGR